MVHMPTDRPLRHVARQVINARPPTEACRRLLQQLRARCPTLLPPDPLPPGSVGAEVPLTRADVQRLVLSAASHRTGREVVWTSGDSELLVRAGKVTVVLDRGLITVNIPVSCDQINAAVVAVPFAVGDPEHPAGMIVATEERPRGPALIVDAWGEALLAFAWNVLLTVTTAVAEASGTDQDGAGLIPAALTATPDGLRVLTMARHTFDRNVR
jgi:hypothetical protein